VQVDGQGLADQHRLYIGLAGAAHGGGVTREEFSKLLIGSVLEVAAVVRHQVGADLGLDVIAEGMH
jgi:hypothetical protein